MTNPIDFPYIRNLTVSGRIASGATTLAKRLAEVLAWELLEGGKLLRKVSADLGLSVINTEDRPDHFDLSFEEKVKSILRQEKHHIIQSHLAGYDAQGVDGVFKILVVCEDKAGKDRLDIRIDRLLNRDQLSVTEAKYEIKEREEQHLLKFRRLYANNDQQWVYWDKKYYDFVVNTYSYNREESVRMVLAKLGYKKEES